MPDIDYSHNSHFKVTFDGIGDLEIMETTAITFEVNKIEVKNMTDDGKYELSYIIGPPKQGEITLTRALKKGKTEFAQWFKEASAGLPTAAKSGAVHFMDPTGKETQHYDLMGAFPKTYEISTVKAGSTDPVTEKLTLVYHSVAASLSQLGMV